MNQTLDFAPNYCHIIELDIAQDATNHDYRYALRGITSAEPSNDESVEEYEYYHSLGMSDSSVEKVKVSIEMTGNRMYGDPVQDFVQSLALETGQARKTYYKWVQPNGEMIEGQCTLSDIVFGSGMGDANARGDFSYTIQIDTVDTHETPNASSIPEAITATDVSVKVGESVDAGAKVTPTTANQKCHYGIEDTTIADVDADGNVKGIEVGETTLTIKAASKPSATKQVAVKVTAGV